jgi:uncharacterized protein YjbI with pentapeptide repeats
MNMSNSQRNKNQRWQRLLAYIRKRTGRLDLSNADLHNADLQSANLQSADLHNADLHNANLRYAKLRYADLYSANLRYANLRYADLSNANLQSADLHNADLHNADLSYAKLRYADLRYANLHNADLRYAKLENVTMNWQSHALVAERLRQAAGADYLLRLAAGYIIMSRELCHDDLIKNAPHIPHPEHGFVHVWALRTMATWRKDGDEFPEVLLKASSNLS